MGEIARLPVHTMEGAYDMQFLFSRRFLWLGVMIAGCMLLPVEAASASTASCQSPLLAQPFLSQGDSGWYTLAPGQSADGFSGDGWELRGGASVVATTLADGSAGYVLDLPPGASATSPVMCVNGLRPSARMITRMVGAPPSDGASMYVSLAGSSVLGYTIPILGTRGWNIPAPINLLPVSIPGLNQVDFTVVSHAKAGDLELYNLYVDPRMR
jgi:hypothetical protein